MVSVVPAHWLLGLYWAAQVSQEKFSVSDVTLDTIDLSFGVVVLAVLMQGLPRSPRRAIPHLGLWLVLAVLLTLSYAVSPSGQENMTDAVRSTYQVYRYAVRMVLMYPLACLLVDTPEKLDDLILCVVLSAVVFACMGIVQGYGGLSANGPFKTKNGLGAALAVATVLVAVDALAGKRWIFAAIALPILLRGLLFASSRGAFAGAAIGIATAAAALYLGRARMRVATGIAAGIIVVTGLFVSRPDLLERRSVVRVFSTTDLQDDNFVWRTQERWPWFWERTMERPWLGWGEAVDESLGSSSALTAHNGYLSISVTNGIPVVVIYVVFVGLAGRELLRVMRGGSVSDRVRAAKVAGGLGCVMMHNIVDAVVVAPFCGGAMWMLVAGAGMLARRPPAEVMEAPAAAPAPASASAA
jgi:O-antigen ligase